MPSSKSDPSRRDSVSDLDLPPIKRSTSRVIHRSESFPHAPILPTLDVQIRSRKSDRLLGRTDGDEVEDFMNRAADMIVMRKRRSSSMRQMCGWQHATDVITM